MGKSVYGYNDVGEKIEPPKPAKYNQTEWEIIPEGGEIPQMHREYMYDTWCQPRRCHSTMTAMSASVWGSVRAYAKVKETR